MDKLTVKKATDYITLNYEQPRHNMLALVKSCKNVAKQYGIDPIDMFKLVIENKPIHSVHTHSYGFHTGNGRELIESVHSAYYENLNN